MKLIEMFFKAIAWVITTAIAFVLGTLKIALGFVVVMLLLVMILVFGILHGCAGIIS